MAQSAATTLLVLHQMLIETRWPAHCLARVVEQEVQPRQRLAKMIGERLDTGRVPQVDAVKLQP